MLSVTFFPPSPHTGKCSEAIEDFNKAIELAPNEPDPFLGRGVANECLQRYEAALEDYEKANQKNKLMTGVEDPVTYNNKANALAGLGKYEEALQNYRQAAKMQKDYVFPLASAALMLYQTVSKSYTLSVSVLSHAMTG